MLTLPVLYSFRRCPYAIRARLALYSAKIIHEHREVNLRNKPLQLLEISPKGTVPVLQLKNENVLDESLDIMTWVLGTSHLSMQNKQLLLENDTTFKHSLDRYKYPGRYIEEEGINYREQCEHFLRQLESQLSSLLTENSLTFIEMAIFPFIRQFAMVDPEWFCAQPYPYLKKRLDFFVLSSLFQQAMQNYSPWVSGDQPIICPT